MCKKILDDEASARSADRMALKPISLKPEDIRCPRCKAKGQMAYHGEYSRHFIYRGEEKTIDEIITITRLKCSSCNSTHAVLPLVVVPYLSYSVCFIASLLADWLSGAWPSIDAISEEYAISAKTFMRLRRRFLASVELAAGKTAAKTQMLAYATRIAKTQPAKLVDLLQGFIAFCGRTFCEGLPP